MRALLAALVALLAASSGHSAQAGPKEDAYAAVEQWAAAFNSSDVDKILSTYTPEATVHGTVSPNLASGPDAFRAYFTPAAANKNQVKLGEWNAAELSRAVVTVAGFYEFSGARKDGTMVTLPARYTFVVLKGDSGWKIAHHHSSSRPKPPQ